MTPFYNGALSKATYTTKIIDLSGSGCKVRLPDINMLEADKMIVEFKLNDDVLKLYADVVRWNRAKRIIALMFTAPYEKLEGDSDPLVKIEERIIQYVFEKQRGLNRLPHFYRHR